MTHRSSRAFCWPAALAVAFVTSLLAPGTVSAQGLPAVPDDMAATRAALEKYQDPIVAVREGYFSTLVCVDFPHDGKEGELSYKAGAMGVHFLNPALIGPALDPMKPQLLIYEPVGDRLQLVAAEWFMPVGLASEAPSIFGTRLDGPMPGHAPILPAELVHWDLHVWLWKENPNGLTHSTNSAVSCPAGPYTHREMGGHQGH